MNWLSSLPQTDTTTILVTVLGHTLWQALLAAILLWSTLRLASFRPRQSAIQRLHCRPDRRRRFHLHHCGNSPITRIAPSNTLNNHDKKFNSPIDIRRPFNTHNHIPPNSRRTHIIITNLQSPIAPHVPITKIKRAHSASLFRHSMGRRRPDYTHPHDHIRARCKPPQAKRQTHHRSTHPKPAS